jgi:hypothetical protein
MFRESQLGALCLSLVAGFFTAAPWSPYVPLNSSIAALVTRAGYKDGRDLNRTSDFPESHKRALSSGAPEYAQGIGPDPSWRHAGPFSESRPIFEKDRKQAVLELIHYPWEDLGFKIVFKGSRHGYRAMTLSHQHRIEIYVRSGDALRNEAYDLAHELGHAFDLKNNTEKRRRRWCELRGIDPSTPWFGCNACPDYGTPAGDFAETFAFLLLGPGNFHSILAPMPEAERIPELAAFCQIEHLSESLFRRSSKENKSAAMPQEERLHAMQGALEVAPPATP